MLCCFPELSSSPRQSRTKTGGIFVCGQTTRAVHEHVSRWMAAAPNTSVRVSATPFNVKNHDALRRSVPYDIPCFGQIPSAALSVLNEKMKQDSQQLSMKFPGFVIDTLVQSKMTKVRKMVAECQTVFTDSVSSSAFKRLDTFAEDFAKMDPESIQSTEEWSSFVRRHVDDPKWQEKLHFDHVLGLFGFTGEVASQIRQMTHTEKNKNGEEETTPYEQFGLRWLAKALTGFKPDGCLTDVVNLIYAMMGDPPEKDQTEQDVMRTLENFKKRLARNGRSGFQDLWIPDKLVHDAESDDMLVWLLLRHVHKKIGSTLDVRVQLPPDSGLNEKEQCWSGQPSTIVFRDQDSKNLDALLTFHTKL